MKYVLLIYSVPAQPEDAVLAALSGEYMAFSQAIIDSGEMVGGDPFEGVDAATSVRVRDGQLSATPGPFAVTDNVLSGYYIIDVKNLHRAVELAARIPDAHTGVVEVRPLGTIPN